MSSVAHVHWPVQVFQFDLFSLINSPDGLCRLIQ